MHLDHKVPWNSAASQFEYAKKWNHKNGLNFIDLQARNASLDGKVMGHFNRVLLSTIREFSESQLQKLDLISPMNRDVKLFTDEVLLFPERHFGLGPHDHNSAVNNPLSADHQKVEYWQRRAGQLETGTDMQFSSGDGDLADAIKMLVIVSAVATQRADTKHIGLDALSALLHLATKVPLLQLRNIHWGHSFGVDLVAEVALRVYMWVNITEAVQSRPSDQVGTENRVSLIQVNGFLSYLDRHALEDYDYPAQNIPHRTFWCSVGVTHDWIWDRQNDMPENNKTGSEVAVSDTSSSRHDQISHREREGLHQYLKDCFAILYNYDVFLRQACGASDADDFWISAGDHVFAQMQ